MTRFLLAFALLVALCLPAGAAVKQHQPKIQGTEMATLNDIEVLAARFADAQATLDGSLAKLQADLKKAHDKHIDIIREQTKVLADAEESLRTAIKKNPRLFQSPRTQNFHGVQVGYKTNAGGAIIFANGDETATVKLIRKHLSEDEADTLIRTVETIAKDAAKNLDAKKREKIGIALSEAEDVVVLKLVESPTMKMVDQLLKSAAAA